MCTPANSATLLPSSDSSAQAAAQTCASLQANSRNKGAVAEYAACIGTQQYRVPSRCRGNQLPCWAAPLLLLLLLLLLLRLLRLLLLLLLRLVCRTSQLLQRLLQKPC
jgi:hypothetical protein